MLPVKDASASSHGSSFIKVFIISWTALRHQSFTSNIFTISYQGGTPVSTFTTMYILALILSLYKALLYIHNNDIIKPFIKVTVSFLLGQVFKFWKFKYAYSPWKLYSITRKTIYLITFILRLLEFELWLSFNFFSFDNYWMSNFLFFQIG